MDDGSFPLADRAGTASPTAEALNLDLQQLTRAERIWLWRRRQDTTTGRVYGKGGSRMSVAEAAAALGIPVTVYRRVERGELVEHEGKVVEAIHARGYRFLQPSVAELCSLARRRAAADIEGLCAALGGISRPTFFAWETLGAQALVDLWRARGFTF